MQVRSTWPALAGVLDRERARLARRIAAHADEPERLAAALRAELVDVRPSLLHARTQARAGRIVAALEDGASLDEALADRPGDFRPWEIALARAAVLSRRPRRILAAWAEALARSARAKDALSGVLVYPLSLLAATAGGWLLLLVTAVPSLAALHASAGLTLPLPTRLLVAGSSLAARWAGPAAALLLAIGLLALVVARTSRGRLLAGAAWLRLPVVGAAARAEQRAIAFEALGGLLEAGRGETEALRLAADAVPSRAARVELREAAERLARGEAGLAGATGPVLGGRAGRALARALGDENAAARVGRLALREAARSEAGLLRSLALVEPLSVLLTGLLVGLAVLGGLLPVLSAVLVRW